MNFKRISAFLLALATAFALGSCGSKPKENDEPETVASRSAVISRNEVEKAAKNGEIIGVPVKLGENAAVVINKYQPTTLAAESTSATGAQSGVGDEDSGEFWDVNIGNELTCIHHGPNQYFYLNESGSDEISVIACSSTAYNFAVGNCFSEDIITSLGEPDVRDIPAKKDLFFLFGAPDNVSRLTYNFDKKRLDFIMVDDNLCMVVLTDTEVYTKMGNTVAASSDSASDASSAAQTEVK